MTFSQVLKTSIERETTTKGWCSKCQRYQAISTKKAIHTIPAVLMLNTAIATPDDKRLWQTPGWLPEEIGLIIDQGQVFCFEGEDLQLHLQRGIHDITVYSLMGMAINIESKQDQKPHLAALINGQLCPGVVVDEANALNSCPCHAPSSRREQVAFVQRLLGLPGHVRGGPNIRL